MTPWHLVSCFVCLCAIILIPNVSLKPTLAQTTTVITPDGTLGTTVVSNGNIFEITDGTRQGPNLFHSFDRFNVSAGDTARFTSVQTGIDHILSRVTGGQQSVIDGLLQSDVPGAHLYFLNPSGIVFGPNAQLDVQGSFHVSTADVVRLQDGRAFAADLGTETALSVAAPIAFGFLRENPSSIRIDGSALGVPTGQTLAVVGGDIDILGGAAGILQAPDGRIRLASATASGEVVFSRNGLNADMERETAVTDGQGIHLSRDNLLLSLA